MNSDTSLDHIWQIYQVTHDCLKIVQLTLPKNDLTLLNETRLISESKEEVENWISKSRNGLFSVIKNSYHP